MYDKRIQERLDRLTPKPVKNDTWAEMLGSAVFVAIAIVVVAILSLLTGCAPAAVAAEVAPAASASPAAVSTVGVAYVPVPATTVPSANVDRSRCVVTTGYKSGAVNVRGGPGMDHPVVDTVREGESLIVYGPVENGWQKAATGRLVEGWFYVERWCKQ